MKGKEIGGYLEIEKHNGSIYHEDSIALNSGRSALRYIIRSKNIRKLYLPYFCCDSVTELCKKENIDYEYYHINKNFRPLFDKNLSSNEWLYIVNFYGQINNSELKTWKDKYKNLIVDNAHAYFQMPVNNVDTIYTCRKFFGVSDGAFLYTDSNIDGLERSSSISRMKHLLGRLEGTANEYYGDYKRNEELISELPVQLMSKITENLLRGIDYLSIEKTRTSNFRYLHEQLKEKNKLDLTIPKGAYMYPLYSKNAKDIRKTLQANKIYIPTLWPEVLDICKSDSIEYDYAKNILPLPVDQRYNIYDMEYIVDDLRNSMEEN